jgi:hypothetical protein
LVETVLLKQLVLRKLNLRRTQPVMLLQELRNGSTSHT